MDEVGAAAAGDFRVVLDEEDFCDVHFGIVLVEMELAAGIDEVGEALVLVEVADDLVEAHRAVGEKAGGEAVLGLKGRHRPGRF